MESYMVAQDVRVFGILVETFPLGIKEAFESLVKSFGSGRSYYGLSWCAESGEIQYYALVSEAFDGEAKKYNYHQFTLRQGEYRTATLFHWMSKTDTIKDIFMELTGGSSPTKGRPCIEWYKSDQEMMCMIKAG